MPVHIYIIYIFAKNGNSFTHFPTSPHIHCTGVAKDALKDAEAQLAATKTKATASNKALSAAQQKVSAADSANGTAGKSLKQAEDKLAERTKQVQKETKIAAEKKKKADKKAEKVNHCVVITLDSHKMRSMLDPWIVMCPRCPFVCA